MNLTDKQRRDDGFTHRLFSYLNKNLPFEIESCLRIRQNIYKLKAKNNFVWIIKGFPTLNKLKIQEYFTHLLKENGFPNTYSFYSLREKNLYVEPQYLGLLEYIPQGKQKFTFASKENRKEALFLLNSYHQTSSNLVEIVQMGIPPFEIMQKWKERLFQFKKNIHFLTPFIPVEILNDLIKWAEWALKGMNEEKKTFWKYPFVILHGDLAHHNFIRSESEQLFLIDFDLISVGPALIDYLQYANRILPFLDWSLEELSSFEYLQPLLDEKLFLYALCYPTDIFREWNQLIRNQSFTDSKKIQSITNFTWNQLDKRVAFYKKIAIYIR